jgi:hypothetical protein
LSRTLILNEMPIAVRFRAALDGPNQANLRWFPAIVRECGHCGAVSTHSAGRPEEGRSWLTRRRRSR